MIRMERIRRKMIEDTQMMERIGQIPYRGVGIKHEIVSRYQQREGETVGGGSGARRVPGGIISVCWLRYLWVV